MSRGAVVLAAGKGTRFRSDLAKVLHTVAGRSMLGWVLEALRPLALDRVVVVVGHQGDEVRAEAERAGLDGLVCAEQVEQRGTGHAVRCAAEAGALDGLDQVVVLPGDVPLLRPEPIAALLDGAEGRAATVLTFQPEDPTGYGRVLRDAAGRVTRIVEEGDADAGERAVREVNSGVYAFDREALVAVLHGLADDNAQGEEYLTDAIAPLVPRGVEAVTAEPGVVAGVNDRAQLADAGAVLRRRVLDRLMRAGVTVVDPAATYVDDGVEVGVDAVLHPGTHLEGATTVAARAEVGPYSRLVDAQVGEEARVAFSEVHGARVGRGATVGPYTYLRAGAHLGQGAKAGAFVEMKNAEVGEGAKVPHLSYVGDAEIGAGANIGAATVTVNYDGFSKHRTIVGPGARVGSDTMLVAPVTIGAEAYTGAGSVITQDVPDGALAVERADQRVVEGYAARKRARHEQGQEGRT